MSAKQKLSDLTPAEAISLLTELGDQTTAEALTSLVSRHPEYKALSMHALPESKELAAATWRGTEHSFGYFSRESVTLEGIANLVSASSLTPDMSLKGERISLSLGSLYTLNYPGWGRHNVLMHFKCRHADADPKNGIPIEFEQKFKSKEGEGAGNIGSFIFSGLRVPSDGLQFEVQTVNISNDSDEAALSILESDSIKNGLNLLESTIASLSPFSALAQGLLRLLLSSGKNKIVQEFILGFDFSTSTADIAKLRTGTYIAVQAKKDQLNWNDWIFQVGTGLIVHKNKPQERLPFNHMTINVGIFSEE